MRSSSDRPWSSSPPQRVLYTSAASAMTRTSSALPSAKMGATTHGRNAAFFHQILIDASEARSVTKLCSWTTPTTSKPALVWRAGHLGRELSRTLSTLVDVTSPTVRDPSPEATGLFEWHARTEQRSRAADAQRVCYVFGRGDVEILCGPLKRRGDCLPLPRGDPAARRLKEGGIGVLRRTSHAPKLLISLDDTQSPDPEAYTVLVHPRRCWVGLRDFDEDRQTVRRLPVGGGLPFAKGAPSTRTTPDARRTPHRPLTSTLTVAGRKTSRSRGQPKA